MCAAGNGEIFLISTDENEYSEQNAVVTAIAVFVLIGAVFIAVAFIIFGTAGFVDTSDDETDGYDSNKEGEAGGFNGRNSLKIPYVKWNDDRKKPPPPAPSSSELTGDQLAARFINISLEWKYSPCNDFYNFVCSKFRGPLPDAISSQSHFIRTASKSMLLDLHVPDRKQSAVEKAAGLFQACYRLGSSDKTSEVRSLRSFLRVLGLDAFERPKDPNFDIPERITQLSLEYGFPTFVKFGYFKKAPNRIKVLDMQIYKPDETWIETSHQRLGDVSLALLYKDYLRLYRRKLDATGLVHRIIRSERLVLKNIKNLRRKERTVSTYVDELGDFTKGYVSAGRWEELIKHYTGDLFDGSDTLVLRDNATELVVVLMDKARLAHDDSRLLIAWSLLRRLLPFAHGKAMITLTQKELAHHPDAVGDFCLQTVHGVMSAAITSHYFRKIASPIALKSAWRVAADVMDTTLNKINDSNWIPDSLRRLMLGKAKNMRIIMGYPKEFVNRSLVEAFFAAFPRVCKDFFTPYVESHRLLTTRIFKEKDTENFTASGANAYYRGSRNTVTIFPSILQQPFFFNNAPASFNYAGLGQLVGHEITHAFDAGSINSSYQDNQPRFDPAATLQEYTKKMLCIRASYEQEEAGTSRARTSEVDRYSEGFADFAGTELAYAAYRRLPEQKRRRILPNVRLSADQIFFVASCLKLCSTAPGRRRRPDSPYWHSRSRCIVPLKNMPEFSHAFSCTYRDYMNPAKRCSFW